MTQTIELLSVLEDASYCCRLTDRTLWIYRRALLRFRAADIYYVTDAQPQAISAFLAARITKGSPKGAYVDLMALLSVLAHLEKSDQFPAAQLHALRRLAPTVRPAPRPQLSAAFLRLAQVEAFLATSPRNKAERQARICATLAAYAGLRRGEAAALRWDAIDTDRRVLLVGQTKTGRDRLVPVCSPLMTWLAQADRTGPYLVGQRPAHYPVLAQGLTVLRERARMPQVTFCLLRHSRASWWVQAGVPLAKVAQWMGHTVDVCVRHYAGLLRGYDADAERLPA